MRCAPRLKQACKHTSTGTTLSAEKSNEELARELVAPWRLWRALRSSHLHLRP